MVESFGEIIVSDNQQNEEQDVKPGFSRRSFIKLAGAGLVATTGCDEGMKMLDKGEELLLEGKPLGGTGWLPNRYTSTGNFPVQVRGRVPIDPNNLTIQRDDKKCTLCGQCAEVCERDMAVMGNYELPLIDDIPCIGCGQCTLWCPNDAITERDDTQKLFEALENPNKHVVVQFAPSTRVGLGEEFGLPAGTNVEGKQITALRKLGFDTVLDTNFAADMTIMEEATELVQRLTAQASVTPMFTSCCPGWVKFCEMFYPELIPHLSTARSPMGMLAPIIKTHYAKQKNIQPENIVSVSVMPCTAKKFEAARPEMHNAGTYHKNPAIRDTDIVITTRELARMIKQKGIDFSALEDGKCDDVLSDYTGGGAIFGVTGGVMEAAVRSAYYFVTKENPPPAVLDLKPVRGLAGIKEAALDVPGFGEVRIAVVSGTANAKKVLEKVKDGTGKWHFMEFMACPGGCISGGGQPKSALPPSDAVRAPRTGALYTIDEKCVHRLSHENPQIKTLYADYLGEPCGEIAHELLHTHGYHDRSINLTAKK
jgi:iron-only hydrogenase group A